MQVYQQGGLAGAEIYAFLSAKLPRWLETLDPVVRGRVLAGRDLGAWEYLHRRDLIETLTHAAPLRLKAVHVAVMPTVATTPPALAEVQESDAYRQANMLALRNTAIANLLGLCAITIPVGLDRTGMPVGLQLLAPGGAEEQLLAVALGCERALGRPADRLGQPPTAKP